MMRKNELKIITYLKESNYKNKKEMLNYLNKNTFDFDEEILTKVLKFIIDNNLDFEKSLKLAKKYYDIIVFDSENGYEVNLFLKVFSRNFNEFLDIKKFEEIFNLFENKELAINIFNKLEDRYTRYFDHPNFLNTIFSYIKEARMYFVNENMFFSSVIKLIEKIENEPMYTAEFIKLEFIKEDKKLAGFNSLEEEKLKKLNETLESISKKEENLDSVIEETLDNLTDIKANLEKEKIDYESINIKEIEERVNKLIKKQEQDKNNKTTTLEAKIDSLINIVTSQNVKEIPKVKEKWEEEKIEPKKDKTIENNELFSFIVEVVLGKVKSYVCENYNLEEEKEKRVDSIIKRYIRKVCLLKEDTVLDNLRLTDYVINYLSLLYVSIYNDTRDILMSVISKGISVSSLKLYFFEKKNAEKFEKDKYIDLIINKPDLLKIFMENDDIDILSKILEINPNYVEFTSKKEKLKEAIKIFGIETISKNIEKLDKLLRNIDVNDYSFIKKLYEKDKDFYIDSNIANYISELKKVYTADEFLILTKNQQVALSKIIHKENIEILEKRKELIKRIINQSAKEELDLAFLAYMLLLDIEKYNTYNFTIEDYFKLDKQRRLLLLQEYDHYTDRQIQANSNKEHEKIEKKFKKEIKKLKM